jgi:ribosomal protein L11 methyltransferase
MPWQQLIFVVRGVEVDALSDALLAAGAVAADVSDADAGTPAEQAQFGEPGSDVRRWPRSRMRALFAADVDVRSCLNRACADAGVAPIDVIDIRALDDEDWVRVTQRQFGPIEITPRLWIVPTWETIPDPNAINLILDPGAAFGTGSHPTTRLCLRWLVDHIRGGESVIDYGSGSGILAIAALRLGAARAVGIDIDPQAVLAARANAMQNQVPAHFYQSGQKSTASGDVVLANILANPLIALAPLLAAATAARGTIVLSGILETQAAEVAEAYRAWFDVTTAASEDGWALLVGRKTN